MLSGRSRFRRHDVKPVLVHHQTLLSTELSQVHAPRNGAIICQIEEDPRSAHPDHSGVVDDVGVGDAHWFGPFIGENRCLVDATLRFVAGVGVVAQAPAAKQMDVVGVGHQLPLHAFGGQTLVAAMLGQAGRFRQVVDPRTPVDEGLELTVDHQVGVAANGRSEVDVSVQVQTEVPAVFFAVPCALHQLEEALVDDASGGFRERARRVLCVLQGGENAVTCLGIEHRGEVRRDVVSGFGVLESREVNAAAPAEVGPVAQHAR